MSFLVLDKTRQMNCPDTIRPQQADSDQWRRGSGNTSQLLSLARSGFILELQMKVHTNVRNQITEKAHTTPD